MAISIATLKAMAAAGATPDMIIAAVAAEQGAEDRARAAKREKDAARQRRSRASKMSRGQGVTSRDTPAAAQPVAAADPAGPSNGVSPGQVSKEERPTVHIRDNTLSLFPCSDEEERKQEGITRAREAGKIFDRDFWPAYPRREGANPKTPARKIFVEAVRSGHDPTVIIGGASRYATEARAQRIERTPYVAQAKTWLSQARWTDYPAHSAEIIQLENAYGAAFQDRHFGDGPRRGEGFSAQAARKARERAAGMGPGG